MSFREDIHIEKNGHTITGRRFKRGKNPYGRGGELVGYRLTCTCGYNNKVNDVKRYAESIARDHIRAHAEIPLRVEYIVCRARGYPDPYAPCPNTREEADRFQRQHGGDIRWRYLSDWQDVIA